MKIITTPLGPVQANCYLALQDGHALCIDPGDTFLQLDSYLEENHAQLDAVVLTHAHFDHIGGVDDIVKKYRVPVYLNPAEFHFLTDPEYNASQSFFQHIICQSKPTALELGKQHIGSFSVRVFYAPGHSIGSSLIQIDDVLFTGDVIFQASIGRMDLPTGNQKDMVSSLEMIASMNDLLKLYPGHGPSTTLAQEKIWNDSLQYVMR